MIVGRETAGWLGEKWPGGKISLSTIINANDEEMMNIIEQSLIRYQKFLKATKPGKSKFKQFYYKVAEILKVKPTSLIYANFLLGILREEILKPIAKEEIKKFQH